MTKIESLYQQFLHRRKQDSLHRHLTPVRPVNARELIFDGKTYLNFSSNDYLGFSHHPALIERAQEWTKTYGAGAGASRLVTGNLDLFHALETKIASLKKTEAALIMVSGYQANMSVLPALFDAEILGAPPLIFSDRLIHASMHAGCMAAGVRQIRFRHNDMDHLQDLLERHKDSPSAKFILTESVFSMDGDCAPLDKIHALAKRYDCFTVIDEAHATGVFGDQGEGLAKDFDLVIGTFGKALGSFGAYIACSGILKDYLVNKCGGLIYATALPPAVLGSIDAALDLLPKSQEARTHLTTLADYFRQEMERLGLSCCGSQSQIIPILIGESDKAVAWSADLKKRGFWINAIRPPTVPSGTARLRVCLSAAHTQDDVMRLIDAVTSLTLRKAA